MSARHWHVGNGNPGYLFDSDEPATFDTRAEATAYARAEATDERDQRNDAASWMPFYRRATPDEIAAGRGEIVPGGIAGLHVRDYRRTSLARSERWTADLRTGRDGAFSVSIDRRHDPYSLPYRWEGWECDGSDCQTDDETAETAEMGG